MTTRHKYTVLSTEDKITVYKCLDLGTEDKISALIWELCARSLLNTK